jgi:predicted Zn-dependent peptidase
MSPTRRSVRSKAVPARRLGPPRARGRRALPRPADAAWGALQRDVLPNGLRVLTARAPGLHSAMVGLYVRAGSRHETPARSGISHFLEHLFFRGSQGFPDSVAMNAAVEAVGGYLNGVTARDHGCYYTPLHPAALGTGLTILGDLIRRPLLKEIEVEREVILEEILDEVDASGRDIDPDNLLKRLVFPGHALGLKIGGTRETVKAMQRRHLRDHLERFYTGANLVLAVAGPVRHAEVLDLAAAHFGALPRGTRSVDRPPPPWPEGPLVELRHHDDAQAELTLAFPCPPEHHPDFPAFLCLRRILDDGLSSRLPFEVVEKRGLAYSLHCGLDTFIDAGMLVVDGACAPPKLARVLTEILRVLAGLAAEEVPADELLRVQRRHRMTLAFSLDSPGDLVGWYGAGEIASSPEGFEERCRRVEAVTPAELRRVAAATFRTSRLALVAVGRIGPRLRRSVARLTGPEGLLGP